MKLFLEIIDSLILHPIAGILAWINSLGRSDLTTGQKILWMIICVIWGIGPILYLLIGNGNLW